VAGGAVGLAGYGLPGLEVIIAASVVVLGIALAVGKKYPLLAATIVVGLFGIVHGHAHGTEMPAMSSALMYGCGFVAATAALHAAGLLAGLWLIRGGRSAALLRLSGAAISLAGMALLLRAI
jgi:urease accessory protein